MKMTLRKIREIHLVLGELSHFKTPVAYAISKNLMIAGRIVRDHDKIREDLLEQHALKDAAGKPIKGLYSSDTHEPADLEIDVNAPDFKPPHGYYVGYIVEDLPNTRTMIDAILDEEHDVVWHQIPESRIAECDVPAVLLVPLHDSIIVEGR